MLREKKPYRAVCLTAMIVMGFSAAFCPAQNQAPTTDYVTELNRIGIAGRPESLNAAPYYEAAMKSYVEQPTALRALTWTWPSELDAQEQASLRNWVQANNQALEQLQLASQKTYCWFKHTGEKLQTDMPRLKPIRELARALQARAMLRAEQGDITAALDDVVTIYKIGAQVAAGPKAMVEKLVGIGVKALAVKAAFTTLSQKTLDANLMKSVQDELEQLSKDGSQPFDVRGEKMYLREMIETDPRYVGLRMYLAGALDYYDRVAATTPWQLHSEKTSLGTEENPLINTSSLTKVIEIEYRSRADTDALIMTLALLRYRADKSVYPQKLDELVSSGHIKGVPTDPFSDKAFVYKRVGNDFILYSFGADCEDDGGDVVRDSKGKVRTWADAADAVFWPVEGPERAENEQIRPRPVAGPVPERPTKSLYEAVTGGDVEQVRLHIAQGTDVNKKDQMGLAPLFYAVQGDKKDIAQVLIDGGADINATDQYGHTPLHLAARGGHYAMCELLVAKGANVAAKNLMGGTPVGMARAGGHEQVAALLSRPTVERRGFARMAEGIPQVERSPAQTTGTRTAAFTQSLHQAVVDGNVEQVKRLISKGADVHAKNRMGWTPLHTAVRNQKKTIAEFLIDKGADINGKDSSGQTPLHFAVDTGQRDMAELLIAKGADINAVSGRGENALSLAKKRGRTEIVDFLLKHGAKEPTLDLTGDRMYRLEEGPQGLSPRADLPRQVQPEAGPSVTSDPDAVENILADPNEIVARIKTFKGLEKSLELVNGRSRYEIREWLQKRTDDRIDLAKAVYRQTAGEIRFVRDVATEEKAKKTTDAAASLLSRQQKRLKTLVEDMEEEMRALRPTRGARGTRGTRGRYRGRYPGTGQGYLQEEGVGGRTSTYSSGTRMPRRGLTGQDAMMRQGASPGSPGAVSADMLDRDEIPLDTWLQGDFDGKIELAMAVHNQVNGQIGSIRRVAVEERARKTTAAIDGILLDRQKRFEKLVAEMEKVAEDMGGSYRGGNYPQDGYTGAGTGQAGSTGEYPRRRR